MTTYNTGNPVPSAEVKDLYDNAQTEDEWVNSDLPTTVTRTGKTIRTLAGHQSDIAAAIAAAGYSNVGDYLPPAAGPTINTYNETFRYLGEFYKALPTTTLPYMLTGVPATDLPLFIGVGDATLRQDLLSAAGATHMSFMGPGAGEVLLSLEELLLDSVSVRRWGAVCDGVADDTAAVQAAIDWCAANNWPALQIPGICRITASLIVDRLVDSTTEEWRVFGTGKQGGGFHVSTAITIFDSSLPMVLDPQSEFVTFQNIRFTASSAALNAKTVSAKFLRMKFLNCYFYRIKLVQSLATYIQSYYLQNCNVRFWPGVFMFATHAFDVDSNQTISEFGAGYLMDFANGCYRVASRGGVHEGAVGGLISTGNVWQLLITGMYFEANAQPSLQFNAGAPNRAISVIGCFFGSSPANAANAAFWEIDWGNTSQAVSIGNTQHNGRLHDNDSIPATLSAAKMTSIGDFATIAVSKVPATMADATLDLPTLVTSAGTGSWAFRNFRRTGDSVQVDFSIVFGAASGSPVQIIGLPYAAFNSVITGVVGFTDESGDVFLIGGSGSGNGNTATTFSVCKDRQGTPYTYAELAGNAMTGTIRYAI